MEENAQKVPENAGAVLSIFFMRKAENYAENG